MAKNITLMGASYSNVPAVDLPQTGGGTARFVDPDDMLNKIHFYNATITSKVHTVDGSLFRSTEKYIPVNSSNVAFASVTIVSASYNCWAQLSRIESNRVYFTIECTADVNADESFTVYVMTVDA